MASTSIEVLSPLSVARESELTRNLNALSSFDQESPKGHTSRRPRSHPPIALRRQRRVHRAYCTRITPLLARSPMCWQLCLTSAASRLPALIAEVNVMPTSSPMRTAGPPRLPFVLPSSPSRLRPLQPPGGSKAIAPGTAPGRLELPLECRSPGSKTPPPHLSSHRSRDPARWR
jgi:hypothetical protein